MIFFLHGPDSYRVYQKLKEIRGQYLKIYPSALQIRDVDCSQIETREAQELLQTNSLFGQKKLVVFRNIFESDTFVALLDAKKERLAENREAVLVLLDIQERRGKSLPPLYIWLKQSVPQQEFMPLGGKALTYWIEGEFQRYGLKTSLQIQELLMHTMGNDLWRLSNVIRTIATWKKFSGSDTRIRISDILPFLEELLAEDVFRIVDAMARKNKKESLGLLYRQVHRGESSQHLFSLLVYQFRTILQVRDMLDRGFSQRAILKKTNIHPYALLKGVRVAQNFSLREAKTLYETLFNLDRDVKTGKIDALSVFDFFISKLERRRLSE